ncbi:sensor histidine kinase [Oceanirhabdus sp. W0125-5]|uniref:sensor histidine kinase n=1 Tax=Oceanirhabdus sp. W0125-5 TaxID=2999116 RepID=UPI0022F30900|nr:HAMP domain-containing sensor histidine kinase [Oceanirhabdus sp. W0125-5]WBW96245.1 HAMP domain-containing sensor histidine kinase [Oceanirhabdus sp. W0125-5]
MKSIKSRIIVSHLIVILTTILIIGGALYIGIKNYYYSSIEDILIKNAHISSDVYGKYMSNKKLEVIADDLIKSFSQSINVEVQIIDNNGLVLADSLSVYTLSKIKSSDIEKALYGSTAVWKGKERYTSENIMAVSEPLKVRENVVGVLRFVTSLEEVNSLINKNIITYTLVALIVIIISTVVSILISKTIIYPIKNVTDTAKLMAKGEFSVRANKKYDDEVGSMADTLNYMAEEILKNEKLKNDFISSVSHELRTPLTSIKGWALTLKLKEFTDVEKRKAGLDIIVEESERLTSLVEELLDFSRFQSGRITLNIEEINIEELLLSILKQMQPRAKRNKISLKVNLHKLPIIKGDRNRLKQVFINIVDNALKFTAEGGCISIYTDFDDDYLCIFVEDNGIGIKPEHLKKVKDKFFKADSKKAGSGIGLAICNEIMILHEGKLEIASSIQLGTKVKVCLKF